MRRALVPTSGLGFGDRCPLAVAPPATADPPSLLGKPSAPGQGGVPRKEGEGRTEVIDAGRGWSPIQAFDDKERMFCNLGLDFPEAEQETSTGAGSSRGRLRGVCLRRGTLPSARSGGGSGI